MWQMLQGDQSDSCSCINPHLMQVLGILFRFGTSGCKHWSSDHQQVTMNLKRQQTKGPEEAATLRKPLGLKLNRKTYVSYFLLMTSFTWMNSMCCVYIQSGTEVIIFPSFAETDTDKDTELQAWTQSVKFEFVLFPLSLCLPVMGLVCRKCQIVADIRFSSHHWQTRTERSQQKISFLFLCQ